LNSVANRVDVSYGRKKTALGDGKAKSSACQFIFLRLLVTLTPKFACKGEDKEFCCESQNHRFHTESGPKEVSSLKTKRKKEK